MPVVVPTPVQPFVPAAAFRANRPLFSSHEVLTEDLTRMRMRRQGPSLVVDAPAKLNLFLDVLGRRSDGYHDLETVMVSIGCYDTLRFTPQEGSTGETLSIRSSLVGAEALPVTGDNLVLKAAALLRSLAPGVCGVQIELFKRIPWGAGLGGGSSDAAAVLVGLNRLWNLGLGPTELHALAARLGSDVNFFLDSAPMAICRGRGELIEPRPLSRPLHFVIAQATPGLRTADVFRQWRAGGDRCNSEMLFEELSGGNRSLPAGVLYNALEPSAAALQPGVQNVLDGLRGCGMPAVAMSGSGSACYGLADSSRQAARLLRLARSRIGGRLFAATTAT